MKTYRCPHCLTKFPYSEVWFKCLHPNDKARKAHEKYKAKVEDVISGTSKRFPKNFAERYAKLPEISTISYEDDDGNDIRNQYYLNIVDNHVFKASRHTVGRQYNENEIPASADCPYCDRKNKTLTHVCPNPACNKEIKIDENERQFIITIAGASANGKSVFLGALLFSIDRYLPHLTPWHVTLDGNAKRYKKAFIDYMVNGVRMPVTGARTDLSERAASVTFSRGEQEKYTFIFCDTPGEIFNVTNDAQLFKSAKHFLEPDFIFMACDPSSFLQIRTDVLNKTDGDYDAAGFRIKREPMEIPTPAQTLSRIISLMRVLDTVNADYTGKPSGKRNVPFAFCLTKSDLIKEAYADNEKISKILEPSTLTNSNLRELSYKKYEANFKEKSNELKSVLEETWFERALVGEIESNFPDSYYCAVSAKGYNADEVTREFLITPTGVLDPFVWVLNSVSPRFFPVGSDPNTTDESEF